MVGMAAALLSFGTVLGEIQSRLAVVETVLKEVEQIDRFSRWKARKPQGKEY